MSLSALKGPDLSLFELVDLESYSEQLLIGLHVQLSLKLYYG